MDIIIITIVIVGMCMALMYFGRTKINPQKPQNKDEDKS